MRGLIHIASQGKQATVKGANYERKIAKKLTEGFGVEFHRTAYSGATSNGASLAGIQSFTGDLFTTDERLNFSFELKTHEKFRLKDVFNNNKIFTNFLAQNVADAKRSNQVPVLILHSKKEREDYVILPFEKDMDRLLQSNNFPCMTFRAHYKDDRTQQVYFYQLLVTDLQSFTQATPEQLHTYYSKLDWNTLNKETQHIDVIDVDEIVAGIE